MKKPENAPKVGSEMDSEMGGKTSGEIGEMSQKMSRGAGENAGEKMSGEKMREPVQPKRRDFLRNAALFAGGATATLSTTLNAKEKAPKIAKDSPKAPKIPPESPRPSVEQNLAEAKNHSRISAKGYASFSTDWHFHPFNFTRHALGENDVLLEILYAGICHSDLHTVSGDHHAPSLPIVPGHEILGRVVAVGSGVRGFKVGDYAGVGCMVNSCGECAPCRRSEEQFCANAKTVFTYNSRDVFHEGEITRGGYASNIVLSEKFAIKVPESARLEAVAPLLCAGITTYSPIRFSNVKKGDTVAVAGLGGLGHMAAKYMVALGAKVVAFDIVDKAAAAKKLGLADFVSVKDKAKMRDYRGKFNFIISTIPYKYDINEYLNMLQMRGEMAIVGLPAPADNPTLDANAMIWNFRRKVYSSLIGGIKETQEMLDFSVKNNIYPEVQIIPIQKLDEAYKLVAAGLAEFRFVIDMKSLA